MSSGGNNTEAFAELEKNSYAITKDSSQSKVAEENHCPPKGVEFLEH